MRAGLPAVLRWPVAHGIVLALTLSGAVAVWVTLDRIQAVPRRVERALRQHNSTLALHTGFLELAGVVRGYVATGDSVLRGRFDELARRLPTLADIAESAALDRADPAPGVRAAADRGLEWYEVFAQPAVALADVGRASAAEDTLGAGQDALDSVTAQLGALAAAQARQAQGASETAARLGRFGTPVVLGAIVLALLMVMVLGAVSVLGRITDRAMRRRTELALVLDAMPYGFVELDAGLRIQRMSRQAAHLFGLERRALAQTPFASLFEAESQREVEAHLRAVQARMRFAAGDTVAGTRGAEDRTEIEARVRGSQDRVRTVVVVGAPLPGQEKAVAAILRDVTRERLMEERLRQSERLATIGTLAAGLAHELNNPLAAISAFARTVDGSRLSAEDGEAIQSIGEEAQRAGRIVRNLLGFARRRQTERKPVSVAPILERVIALRRYELRNERIDVKVDCPADLPLILADEQQIQQVILNLVVNAHHAMLERLRDGRRLTIRARGGAAAGVTIAVEDTGPGIASEILPRLFDAFFTTKPEGAGTGLGLSISHGIIGEHGGRMWAENRQEGGARFVVELPDVVAPEDVGKPTAPRPAIDVRPQRILVADDDDANRRALQRVLLKLGHEVETVENGRGALERLGHKQFDIVISDLHMSELSGAELFQAVERERPELARHFLFLSGDTVSQQSRAFLEATGQPALRKPYEIDELQHMIARLASGNVRARASRAYWSVLE